MKRIISFLILLTIPFTISAKEYINTAVRINLEQSIILGVMDINGEQKLFNFELKDADYNDGKTFVIYKKWLPDVPEGYGLRMHVQYPDELLLVAESNRSKKTAKGTMFEFDKPADGIVIAFSDQWVKQTTDHKGVDISTYFTSPNQKYAERYFSRVKELLDIYTKMLGKYPYSSFSIVDVPYPAGHALTGLTFISGSIIGMPFLTEISLGHELVHQWAGVGVEAETDGGNWAEGLTTFLADRTYAEQKGEGAEYRKNALISYMAHARQKEPGTCLMDFRYNENKSKQAVGYAKGMMVFDMLETMLGEADFEKGLRAFFARHMFEKADWDDITAAMEDVSGIHLRDFMNGWLGETALAELSLTDIQVKGTPDGYSLSYRVKNKHKWLEYPLEVRLITEDGGEIKDYLYVKQDGKSSVIKTKSKPVKLVVDPEYKAARFISEKEARPALHYLFSKYKKTVFVNPAERDTYAPLLVSLENTEVVSDSENPYKYTDNNLVFLGRENRAYEKLYRKPVPAFDGEFMLQGIMHPMGAERMSYLVISKDAQTSGKNAGRISHYGKYSSLVLTDGRSYEKNTDNSEKGLQTELAKEKQGVAVQKAVSIKDIAEAHDDVRVFLVGEVHSEYAHHENQYEIIRWLHSSGRDVAIGLEMFQRKFQRYLDAYISGDISLNDMLKGTEYYDRWRFDFRLYQRIFDYAKKHQIPLIALNLEQELTKQVSKDGIASLTDDERAQIPEDIDYTGGDYREFLRGVFSMHEMGREFNNFYEAQLLWDETMAETASDYLKANDKKTMVVLAGNGHIRYGYGIADRIKRRTGLDYVTIVQDEQIGDGVADYMLHPAKMEYEESPKIGVMVDETDDGLLVKEAIAGRMAEKAGVKKGDYIVGFNGVAISDLSDIRIALTGALVGETYELTVQRDGKDFKVNLTF